LKIINLVCDFDCSDDIKG